MHPRDIAVLLIFLGIGAFNQWAKKRKAEADKKSGLPSARPQPRRGGPEMPSPAPLERPRPVVVAAPEDEEEDRDEDEFESAPRPRPLAAPPEPMRQAKAAGKDLLAQLAKELGLEIPGSSPAPQPGNIRVTHRSAPPPPAKASNRAPARPQPPEPSPSSPAAVPIGRLPENRPAVAEPMIAFADISDAAALRRAFVLKTILDKPLSLEPRLPGA